MPKKAKPAKSSKTPKNKTLKSSPSIKSIASPSDIKIKPGDTRNLPFLHKHRFILACLLLVVATLVAYWPVQDNAFVNFDDKMYVYENRHVQDGLTLDGLSWALTTTHASNWHPVTWVSHMLDCQIFGLKPGWHHLSNLIFHITNALLILLILLRMTGDFWKSSFVAGLFALHPLHVESVAWVAERKDVLSTLFFLLAIWSYIRWVERPKTIKYLLVLFLLALGLMTKPMVVTFPFVLILIDYWPLKRLRIDPSDTTRTQIWQSFHRLFLEKVPMFVLVTISSAITFYAQRQGGAVSSLDSLPLAFRVGNASVSYINYIIKMIYPSQLAVLYPLPETLPWWKVTGALLLLVFITLFAVKTIRKVPYITVGWFWYVGTLVPVIGLVQVGRQAIADRYTYIPLIGIFIIIAWGIPELMASAPRMKKWLATSAAIVLLILMVLTQKQTQHWKNSITLFTHTLEVTSNNPIPHNNLGHALANKGQTDDAIEHFREALRIKPDFQEAHDNLGHALASKGQTDDAIEHFREALRIKPDFVYAHNNLGSALAKKGQTDDAIKHYREALRIKPDYEDAHNNLGSALANKGQTDDAIEHFREALRIKPDLEEAHNNLGSVLAKKGQTDEAIEHFLEALRIKPDFQEAHNNLGSVLAKKGQIDEAIRHYQEALRIKPDYVDAHVNFGNALFSAGQTEGAIAQYVKAVHINPYSKDAHNNLGNALLYKGEFENAIKHYREALRIKPDLEEAHNNLAVAYYQTGNTGMAVKHFQKAIEINPNSPNARENLQQMLMLENITQ